MTDYNDPPHSKPMVAPRPTLCRFILPTFNRLGWLQESVESVLRSANVELWILAQGCDDGTDEYLEKLSESDPRVHYSTREENKRGGYWDLVQLLPDYDGYLCLWSDDDHALPLGIERKRNMLDNHPELSCVFSGVRWMDAHGTDQGIHGMGRIAEQDLTGGAMVFRQLILADYMPSPTVLMRTRNFKRFFPILEEKEHALCDWQLWLHAAHAGLQSGYVVEPTVRYRIHAKSDSTAYTTSGRYVQDHLDVWKYWADRGYRPTLPELLNLEAFISKIAHNCGQSARMPLEFLQEVFS